MSDSVAIAEPQHEAPSGGARRRRWLLAALAVLIVGVAASATGGLLLRASGQRRERAGFPVDRVERFVDAGHPATSR